MPVGPQVDRILSAPQPGLTTLRDEKAVLKATRDEETRAAEAAAAAAPAEARRLLPPPQHLRGARRTGGDCGPGCCHAAALQCGPAENRRAGNQRGAQVAIRREGSAGS